MHFDQCLADQSSTKECPEWDEKMSASNASQVKERVRNGGE